ncbi:tyrosine-protein phosphatase Lar-like [Sycon ciliatum]|uniref:tyrosine-protein phosphatase Lar-like n=1 Tax=Sycon ciliatum TaxID=27933 RepID=UPI0031F6AEB7
MPSWPMAMPWRTSAAAAAVVAAILLAVGAPCVRSEDQGGAGQVSIINGNASVRYAEGTARSSLSVAQCQITAGSVTDLMWIQNGMKVVNKVTVPPTILPLAWTAAVPAAAGNIMLSDAGIYNCQGFYTEGPFVKNATAPEHINIRVAEAVRITSMAASMTLLHGQPLDITCVASGYQVNTSWTRPSVTTAPGSSSTSRLVIPATDVARDDGLYTCTAESDALCTVPSNRAAQQKCFPSPVRQAITVTIQVNPPGRVQALKRTQVASTHATLAWDPPSSPPPAGPGQTPVTSYHIVCVFGTSSNVTSRVVSSPATVSNLPIFSTVNCSVRAENAGGIGPAESTGNFQTRQGAPSGKPTIEKVSAMSASIDFTIKPPALAQRNGVLTGYKVTYSSNCAACPGCCQPSCKASGTKNISVHHSTQETPIDHQLDTLCNANQYTVSVSACSQAGCGVGADTHVVTANGKPTAPENLTATVLSSSAVRLQWQNPSPSTFGLYSKFTVTASATADRKYFNGVCQVNPPNLVVPATQTLSPGQVITSTVSQMCPSTVYVFTVVGENNAGTAVTSTGATTTAGKPSAPQLNLTALSATTIRVEWTLLTRDRAGPLTKFMLHLVSVCTCCCHGDCASEENIDYTATDLDQVNKYSTVLTGLCPSTEYEVDITTYNSATQSLPSDHKHVDTLAGLPDNIVDASCNVTSVNPHLIVVVHWRPPKTPKGIISAYTVKLQQTFFDEQAGKNRTSTISTEVYDKDIQVTGTESQKPVGAVTANEEVTSTNNNTVAKIPELPDHSTDEIAGGSQYYYEITAATAGGQGATTIVRCASGWTKPGSTGDNPGDGGLPGYVVALIVILVLAGLIALAGLLFHRMKL